MLALATPPVIAWATYGSWQQVTTPNAGLLVNQHLRLESVDSRWERLQKGDRVIRIAGESVQSPTDAQHRLLDQELGSVVEVEVQRGTARVRESGTTTRVGPLDQLAVWMRLLIGVVLLFLGLVAFVLRPNEIGAQLMSINSVAISGLMLAKMMLNGLPSVYYPVGGSFTLASAAITVHFLCVFPTPVAQIDKRPWRVAWVYVVAALAVTLDQLLGPRLALEYNIPATGYAAGPLTVVLAVGATGVALTRYLLVRKQGNKRDVARLRAIASGIALGLAIPAIWNGARHSLNLPSTPFAAYYNAMPVVLFPVLAVYAAIRHNALAIDRFTAAVVGYVITLSLLGGAFAAAVFGLPWLIGEQLRSSPTLLAVATAICGAAISPLYQRLKRSLDKRFSRDQVDTQRMAEAIRKLVFSIQEASREEALQSALQSATILQPENAQLWVLDATGESFERLHVVGPEPAADTAASLSRRTRLAEGLSRGVSGGLEGLAPRLLVLEAQQELATLGLALVVPVVAHGVLAGFVGLGRKKSGGSYAVEDLSFLSVVGAQIGLALERSSGESANLGRYRLEKRVGIGGMAEVFLAWQVGPSGFERKVAVKRPLPQLADEPGAATMFLDEARIASELHHPNIAQVFDVGQHSGTYFIAMEYVEGPSLRDMISKLRAGSVRLSLRVAAGLVIPVLEALHYAHERHDEEGSSMHIVHRDVTPRNVLIDKAGRSKLLDFGIARATSRVHKTQTGTVRGTLPYMSPEQVFGEELDRRSDVYSVGAVFYELLTLERAFPEGPREEGPRSEPLIELPDDLVAVIRRATAWKADDRYTTAEDMRAAMHELLGDDGIADQAEICDWLEEIDSLELPTPPDDPEWETETASAKRAV